MCAPRLAALNRWLAIFRKRRLRLGGALLLLGLGMILSRPPQAEIRLAFLGDLMLGRGVAVTQAAGHRANPLALLAGDLAGADLAFANLESPLTGQPLLDPNGYDLRAAPETASTLALSGLDVLSLANNHSLDSGPEGLQETRSALAANGLTGIASGDLPVRLEIEGIRLVVLAYESVSQPLDLAAVESDVRREKSGGAVVLVSLHWGGEFRPAADPAQRRAARLLAEAGADLIWGHHPHVLQPLEWLERPEPYHPTLVVYSLGNALFDQVSPPDARWGALLIANLDAHGIRGLELRPFEIDPRSGGLQDAKPETAAKIRERLHIP
jgi:poly-gamma-glutamate capsule biosynthesis protein CapA/YwtB (metallophosphatase superfamily)